MYSQLVIIVKLTDAKWKFIYTNIWLQNATTDQSESSEYFFK